ncbi:hypothetical protein M422DRAFT_240318 [Sphaerobolus stellatus SS14]|nr:hypothetical protein M422DRAFT_240318 [Sphaerobolus stellatus SS14]
MAWDPRDIIALLKTPMPLLKALCLEDILLRLEVWLGSLMSSHMPSLRMLDLQLPPHFPLPEILDLVVSRTFLRLKAFYVLSKGRGEADNGFNERILDLQRTIEKSTSLKSGYSIN